MKALGPAFLLIFLLLFSTPVWPEDKCDWAGKEIDNLTEQIQETVKKCAPPRQCSKEEIEEVSAQIKPLIERGLDLTRECFGVPDAKEGEGGTDWKQ